MAANNTCNLALALTVLYFSTTIPVAVSEPPWLNLKIDKPKPGDQFDSPTLVDLDVSLLEGGLSDEIRHHPEQYHVCYAGGEHAICTLLRGDGLAHKFDTAELDANDGEAETSTHESEGQSPPAADVEGALLEGVELRELMTPLPKSHSEPPYYWSNRRNRSSNSSGSSESNSNRSSDYGSSTSNSSVGVIRTWLSHVSKPFVAMGLTDAVFVWKDPHRAELELRHRLDAHPAAAAKAAATTPSSNIPDGTNNEGSKNGGAEKSGGGQAFSGLDAVLWSGDVANEAIAERARLLYHLGVCLHQQIANVVSSTESCSTFDGYDSNIDVEESRNGAYGWNSTFKRSRFDLAIAAIEALSRAYELGQVAADGELKALRLELSKSETTCKERPLNGDVINNDEATTKISNWNSDKTTAQLLEDAALITISNAGYSDYTLNVMASLRIHCRLPCVLQVVCLDQACLSKLNNSFEARHCAEATIHHAASLFASNQSMPATTGTDSDSIEVDATGDDDNGEPLSAFASYRSESFNAIVRYKFEAISYFLAHKRVVVFTDGDIVFLRRSFLQEAVASLGSWRGGNDGTTLEMLAQCDASPSARRCDTVLCSGFMAILSTPDTRRLFDPALVFNDVEYADSFHDQDYLNHVVSKALPGRIDTLPRREFPNGAFRASPHFNVTHARMVHFNYNIGHTKARQMEEAGLWFVDTTTGDTRREHQQ